MIALPVEALVHADRVDDATARALLAKRNPVIVAAMEAAAATGLAKAAADATAEALARAIVIVFECRKLDVPLELRAQLEAERDVARLERWLAQAVTCASADDLFA